MSTASPLNISLESHLVDVLHPLPSHLPPDLSALLVPYLSTPSPQTIPYYILLQISRWSRTESFPATLNAKDYSMVALLAGTTTSPERRFPSYVKDNMEQHERERVKEDKKALTALVNAVLSVGGAGLATWWVAEGRGWNNEWRILLALLVSIVVAVSETILYIIWQSRRMNGLMDRRTRLLHAQATPAECKKDDGGGDDQKADVTNEVGLRHRAVIPRNNHILEE